VKIVIASSDLSGRGNLFIKQKIKAKLVPAKAGKRKTIIQNSKLSSCNKYCYHTRGWICPPRIFSEFDESSPYIYIDRRDACPTFFGYILIDSDF